MVDEETRLGILTSWPKVAPDMETLVGLFYMRLFEQRPDLRRMFPRDLANQRHKLAGLLCSVVGDILRRDGVVVGDSITTMNPGAGNTLGDMMHLGQHHHSAFDWSDDSFGCALEALRWAMDEWSGSRLVAHEKTAWASLLTLLVDCMRLGAMVGNRRVA